jgi:hypothetical protein
MRRTHRKTAVRDSTQMALLAPWVAGARVMTAMADLQRGRFDAVETTRMWTEKSAAFAESWMKANAALLRCALTMPLGTGTTSSVIDEVASAMTAPARRRVVGNARRLAKKRRR